MNRNNLQRVQKTSNKKRRSRSAAQKSPPIGDFHIKKREKKQKRAKAQLTKPPLLFAFWPMFFSSRMPVFFFLGYIFVDGGGTDVTCEESCHLDMEE